MESYECGDISLEEANILMEAVDEEVSKLDDKASKQAKSIKQINDKFVSSYKQASKAYKVYVKEIKGLIKRREYDDARKTIGEAKRQLQDILTIVKNTPSTLSATAISRCYAIMKEAIIETGITALISYSLAVPAEATVQAMDRSYQKHGYYTGYQNGETGAEVIRQTTRAIPRVVAKTALRNAVVDGVLSAVKSKGDAETYAQECNAFKNKAIRVITKEFKKLNTLEKKLP